MLRCLIRMTRWSIVHVISDRRLISSERVNLLHGGLCIESFLLCSTLSFLEIPQYFASIIAQMRHFDDSQATSSWFSNGYEGWHMDGCWTDRWLDEVRLGRVFSSDVFREISYVPVMNGRQRYRQIEKKR